MPGKPLQGLSRREREVVSGTSRRGMIASLVALRRPDVVQRVISLSGSYYWKPADEPQYVGCRLDMPGSGARPFVSTWPQASSRHSSTRAIADTIWLAPIATSGMYSAPADTSTHTSNSMECTVS